MKTIRQPSTVLYPVPAVLVSCGSDGEANIITLAWVGTLCSKPPIIGIGIRPGRHSHGLIVSSQEFVVNLPTADQAEQVDFCGTVSGRNEDKWTACNFTAVGASQVHTPLIAECPVNIECTVQQVVRLGTHDLFLGEVVAVQVESDLLDERGRMDAAKACPLTYINGDYHRVGELVASHGFSRLGGAIEGARGSSG